jgi:hypothetical protein
MLSHMNREGGRQQGSGFSSLLMSVFSRSEPTTASVHQQQHQHTFTGASTSFHNVLEVGVGSNVVKLTLSESGLKTERVDTLGKSVTVHYGLTKIEWYAVDDATGELLIQYHEFNTDDKYQVAFRSPQYRTIWDCFCHYLSRKGEKLAQSQKERELRNQKDYHYGEEDAIAPPLPSPGGSPAVPSHHSRPTSGDHDYYHPAQPTSTTASPSVGRSSARGSGPTKKMPAIHLSPRISVADLPSAGYSPSLSPLSKSHSPDGASSTDSPLIVLPPPPRSRTASPSVGRMPLPPGPVSPSFSAFQSPSGSFDMPALPSPGLSTQRREDALPLKKLAEPTPSAPAFDLINW